jgi:hypothetical protein
MEHWGVEKKWLMIHQDHQAELLASGVKYSKLQDAVAERASIDISRLPPPTQNTSASSPLSPRSRLPTRQNTYSSASSADGPTPTKSISSPTKFVNTITTSPTNTSTISSDNNTTTNNDTAPSYPPIITTSSPKLKRSRSIVNLSPVKPMSTNSHDHFFDTNATDHTSPEYFVRKFLDPNLRSVTPKIAASLEVSLRTRSIE